MKAPTVLVRGASAGIGRAVARAFGVREGTVPLIARGTTGLATAAHDVEAGGGRAVVLPVVADRPRSPVRATEVTYLGCAYATRAGLPRVKARDRGVIVDVGSALAYRGFLLQTAYCGAKHAIQGFHEALRCELLHERGNVPVTMVPPTTALVRRGRVGQLLVLSSTTGAVDELIVASVTQRIAAHCTHPMVVMPRRRRGTAVSGRVVVAVLGLDDAPDDTVVAFAAAAARRTGRPLARLETQADAPDSRPVDLLVALDVAQPSEQIARMVEQKPEPAEERLR